jgi:hypothetical protein
VVAQCRGDVLAQWMGGVVAQWRGCGGSVAGDDHWGIPDCNAAVPSSNPAS